ncbi:uncharacterized protein THITE_2129842 [Thermothielavioides terrestris NRRL 8126]|uniref:Cyanovirin-N domain-containing protein n=1 Tax=Thermothielavioides terrestris (strain ATCC 38088 / NRRL 8126) TaxID=578455 RepID=G2R7Y8_THETT|nr:uncharacterized protein THITE_2129842 [Thermothielavioides terrestris NRRL 8126]AEO68047.1 hypothetical protein THITE_2129842 [Thermothielavioides terrestris NRRL 8126]
MATVLALFAATAATAAAVAVPELGAGAAGGVVVRNITPPAHGGGFVKHCYTYEVGERGELVGRLLAKCGDDERFDLLHNMWLDLNYCLGNYDGQLVWQDGCRDCASREFDTQWIECQCRNTKFNWQNTALDLNVSVRYDENFHVLACFQHLGVRDDPTA